MENKNMKPAIKLITSTLFLLLAACGGGSDGSSLLFPSSGQVVNLPPQVVEPLATPVVQVGVPEPVVVTPEPVAVEPEIEVVVQSEPETEVVVVTPDPEPIVQPEIEAVEQSDPPQNAFRTDTWFAVFEEYNTTNLTRIVEEYTWSVVGSIDVQYFQENRFGRAVEFTIDDRFAQFTLNNPMQGGVLLETINSGLFGTSCGTSLFSGTKSLAEVFRYSFDEDFNFDRNCDDFSGGLRIAEGGGTSDSARLGGTFFIGADFEDGNENGLTGGYNVTTPDILRTCSSCIRDGVSVDGGFSAIEIDDLCISNTNIARSISVTGSTTNPNITTNVALERYDNEFTTFCDGTTVSKNGTHTTASNSFDGQIEVTITATNGEQIRITDFADPNTQTEVLINGSERVRSNIELTGHIANTTPTFNR